jgi:HSP20 family protein
MYRNYLTPATAWNPWQEMQRFYTEMNRAFGTADRHVATEFPPVNVWAGETGLRMFAEIPGLEPNDLEVTVVDDTLTLKGSRSLEALKPGESYHRQERETGKFVRTIQLPFKIESDSVKASFKNGVLEVELPRAKSEMPRKITVEAAA